MTAAHGSILTILAISFERYYAICEPLKAGYTCTQMRAMAIIVIIWLVALIITSPILLMSVYQEEEEYYDGSMVPTCNTKVETRWKQLYYLAILVIFFLIPFLVLLIVYGYIARHLMLGSRVLASSTEEYQMRARKQVVFMLIAVVVCFFFCLLPFRIFTLWIMLATDVQSLGMETYYNILYFCRLLLYMNSSLNPVLYNVISSKFRNSLFKLLKCSSPKKFKRQVTKGTTTSSSTATTSGSIKTALHNCNISSMKPVSTVAILSCASNKRPQPQSV